MVRLLAALVAALLFSAVGAEGPGNMPRLKVYLPDVVKAGVVIPVNGISAAGQPDEAALRVFSRSGYTTVIDLRGELEDRGFDEARVVEGLGMDYILFPITGLDAISFENAEKLDRFIAAAEGPVLVHCASSNRVGALLALSKSLDGADTETAMAFGKAGGLARLEGAVKKVLDSKVPE